MYTLNALDEHGIKILKNQVNSVKIYIIYNFNVGGELCGF